MRKTLSVVITAVKSSIDVRKCLFYLFILEIANIHLFILVNSKLCGNSSVSQA